MTGRLALSALNLLSIRIHKYPLDAGRFSEQKKSGSRQRVPLTEGNLERNQFSIGDSLVWLQLDEATARGGGIKGNRTVEMVETPRLIFHPISIRFQLWFHAQWENQKKVEPCTAVHKVFSFVLVLLFPIISSACLSRCIWLVSRRRLIYSACGQAHTWFRCGVSLTMASGANGLLLPKFKSQSVSCPLSLSSTF